MGLLNVNILSNFRVLIWISLKKRITDFRHMMSPITVQEGSRYDVFARMVRDMCIHRDNDRGNVHALLS